MLRSRNFKRKGVFVAGFKHYFGIDIYRFNIIQITTDLKRIALKRGPDKWAGHEEYSKYFEEDIVEGTDADLNKQMEGLFR